MLSLGVIDDAATAVAALDPVRSRVLAALAEPGSATTVAKALGLSRQLANHHVRSLEAHGLVELVEERPRRGLVERVVQASAAAYVFAPPVLTPDPATQPDKLSARYLLAVVARSLREVASLSKRADAAGKTLATATLDADVRFRSAHERAAFTAELTQAFSDLVARYHDEHAPNGRWHRVVVVAHPHG